MAGAWKKVVPPPIGRVGGNDEVENADLPGFSRVWGVANKMCGIPVCKEMSRYVVDAAFLGVKVGGLGIRGGRGGGVIVR